MNDRGMKNPAADDSQAVAPDYSAVIPAEQLLQDERPSVSTVPVLVTTPVQVREMPSRNAAARTANVGTVAVRLLTPDPRRKRATLLAFDQEIWFGPTQASATARWPKLTPLYLDTRDEVWVASATSTTDVTVITEAWAQ